MRRTSNSSASATTCTGTPRIRNTRPGSRKSSSPCGTRAMCTRRRWSLPSARRTRFLPDRYVEGTCPHCGFPRARGDQCENCGRILDPFELKDPKCKIHGTTPIPKETKHFFFRLSAFEKHLSKWAADDKEHWRHHVLTFM